jgi:hypothetical protein
VPRPGGVVVARLRVALFTFGSPEPTPAWRRSHCAGLTRVAIAPLSGRHAALDGIDVLPATRPCGFPANAASYGAAHCDSFRC